MIEDNKQLEKYCIIINYKLFDIRIFIYSILLHKLISSVDKFLIGK